ncbi:putative inositol monophosphatase 3 [Bacillus rossius redtenbacheri]|uniref:putative inositol monophosphatase 3 n=1 Tax=Bacillus rossius redtenbacheri TaxID=93214 RepID=UPI002FDC829F
MNLGGTIRFNRVGVCVVVVIFLLLLFYMNSGGGGSSNSIGAKSVQEEKNTNSINLRKLLIAAIEVAEKGGKEVIAVQTENDLDEKIKGKTKEGVKEPVTRADLNSHCVMFYSLKRLYPALKVISEEKKEKNECSDLLFLDSEPNLKGYDTLPDETVPVDHIAVWIDPLDATKEFTEKKLDYVMTMVCVAVDGKPVIGVIHKPFGAEPRTTWAWVGKKFSSNLKVLSEDDIGMTPKIIVSMSHAGEVKNVSEKAFGKSVDIIAAAGAGYKSLEVAQGNATAYVHTTAIKKWDVCAGDAVLSALGGSMTTLSGRGLDYAGSAAAENRDGLLATLARHGWYKDKLGAALKPPAN